MLKRYVKYNASQNEECRVSCSQCHGETRHKVLSSVDISADDDEYGIYYWEQNQIIQCQGCETISFRRGSSNSEDLVWDDETKNSVPEVREEIYPSRVAGRHKLNKTYFLPLKVASIYEETHSALCNKLPVLAGIGIRALIETVCKEKNASGDNLQKKIDN
jgi:hypothetical protein